jgi:hypothetical protein
VGRNVNPYLSHHDEKRSRHTLLVSKCAFGDEERPGREDDVRPKYDNHRTRESVRPIGLSVPDKREENIPKRRQKRADACGRSVSSLH